MRVKERLFQITWDSGSTCEEIVSPSRSLWLNRKLHNKIQLSSKKGLKSFSRNKNNWETEIL